MNSMLALLLLFMFRMSFVASFVPLILPARSRRSSHVAVLRDNSGSDEDDVAKKLRASAQKLRDEVRSLESKLDRTKITSKRDEAAAAAAGPPPVSYTSLEDSVWTLTYRFASDPPDDDDNGNDNGGDNDDTSRDQTTATISRYSGKMTVKFRADGYTDLLCHEPAGSNALEVVKVWGWDREAASSSDDDEEYILFSASAQLPDTDATAPNEALRFYWQARIDSDDSTTIRFEDGTVTVKKDVTTSPKGGGRFWGIFNAGGILAQFRYVGNFIAKPATEHHKRQ